MQFDCLLRLPALAGDHAQQLQCATVPGAGLQDFPVQCFGAIELSLLMQAECVLQFVCIGVGCGGGWWAWARLAAMS